MNPVLSTQPLPKELLGPIAWVAKNRLYVGGGTSNAALSEKAIYFAPINEDGSLGSWTIAGYLPLGGRYPVAAKLDDNRVIIVPGVNLGTDPGPYIYLATIAGDGKIQFSVLGDNEIGYVDGLPVLALSRRLILWTSKTHSAPFSGAGLGRWQVAKEPQLPDALNDTSCCLKFTGDLGVSIIAVTQLANGIVGDSTLKQSIWTCRVNADESLDTWKKYVDVPVVNRLGMASVMTLKGPILCGGYQTADGGITYTENPEIWQIKMNAHGDIIGVVSLGVVNTPRDGHAAASNGKFMYIVGGEDVNSTILNSIEIFDIRGM